MNYSQRPGMVRVDFFKPSGKWKETVAMDMSGVYDFDLIHDAVRTALRNNFGDGVEAFKGLTMVILEPYHKNAHPILMVL